MHSIDAAIRDASLSMRERLMLCLMCWTALDGEFYMHRTSIAEALGVSEATVKRSIVALRESGHITSWRTRTGWRHRICRRWEQVPVLPRPTREFIQPTTKEPNT